MEITQRFVVGHPLEVVWQALADVRLVAECLPGAEITEVTDDNRCAGRFNIKLGPIGASFEGAAEITRDDASHSATVEGKGVDRQSGSRSRGSIVYALSALGDGGETEVAIKAEFVLSGALAQFGRGGIVNDIAARLTAEFADNLQRRLSVREAGGDEPTAPREVRPLSLFLSVLWARAKALLGRLFARS